MNAVVNENPAAALLARLAQVGKAPVETNSPAPAPDCGKCRGSGNFVSYKGRVVGPCFACQGTGKQSPAQPRAATAQVQGAGFAKLLSVFAAARASGLKWPKLRCGELQFSPAGESSKNPGCVYIKSGENYLGKINPSGEFFKAREASPAQVAQIGEIARDPLAAAVAHGKQTGHCSCCGRLLENEESVSLGIGPICREKWGL